jgi:hypothetical protein
MKPVTLLIIVLASALAFGQKFQDVSAAGCPVSLSMQKDSTDVLVVAHKNSTKDILAIVSSVPMTDNRGQVIQGRSTQDYAFKYGPVHSQQERPVMPVEAAEPGTKIVRVEGEVQFVQYSDGTTWGDPATANNMLSQRPEKFAYLNRLVELYDTKGNKAFLAALDDKNLPRPLDSVAGCLKVDAEAEKIAYIDLARKRLVDAQSWHTYGIF